MASSLSSITPSTFHVEERVSFLRRSPSQPISEKLMTIMKELAFIKDQRMRFGMANAGSKKITAIVSDLNEILENRAINETLFTNSAARNHLEKIHNDIKALFLSKTLKRKINRLFTKVHKSVSNPQPEKKQPILELKEEKSPSVFKEEEFFRTSLSQEMKEQLGKISHAQEFIYFLEDHSKDAVEIVLECINTNHSCCSVFLLFSSFISNWDNVFNDLAKQIDRFVRLPNPNNSNGNFLFGKELLERVKEHDPKKAKEMIAKFINSISFEIEYMACEYVFKYIAFDDSIKKKAAELLSLKMLNEELTYRRINDFINYYKIPLVLLCLPDKEWNSNLCDQITYLDLRGYTAGPELKEFVSKFPNAKKVVYPA